MRPATFTSTVGSHSASEPGYVEPVGQSQGKQVIAEHLINMIILCDSRADF